jgi:hypothetical protein
MILGANKQNVVIDLLEVILQDFDAFKLFFFYGRSVQ